MAMLPAIASSIRGAMVPIAYGVVTGSAVGNITFSNIPQGYQDLHVVMQFRSTYNGTDYPFLQINSGVAGAVCSFTQFFGNGSSPSSYNATGSGNIELRDSTGSNQSTGIYSSITADFLNYANTTTYKNAISRNASDWNGSGYTHITVALSRSTAAISSLMFSAYNGNLAVGSSIELFGVRKAGQ